MSTPAPTEGAPPAAGDGTVIVRKLTHAQAILSAACTFAGEFSPEDLIVAAWKQHPTYFSLDGFPKYPAAHKVFSKLHGAGGLIDRGHIDRIAHDRLQVSLAGRRMHRAQTGQLMDLPRQVAEQPSTRDPDRDAWLSGFAAAIATTHRLLRNPAVVGSVLANAGVTVAMLETAGVRADVDLIKRAAEEWLNSR